MVPLCQVKDFNMINVRELPLILLLVFTLIYSTIGDPDNKYWSGAYFLVNYLTMLMLFKSYKSKTIRIIGISLSVSVLVFIVLKFFLHLDIDRIYTLVPFIICIWGLIKIDKRNESHRRKNL